MPTDHVPAGRARYGVLVAALFLSAACQVYVVSRSPIIAKDGMGFIQIAKSLAIDPPAAMRAFDQHPGYPAMVLACERVYQRLTAADDFRSFIVGSRLASGICGLGTLIFLWLFARRLYDDRIANLTVLLAAVWPLFRLNASDSLSDTPHLMFYLAGVWLACEGLCRRRSRWFAAAGIASGLAFWVRPEGLVVAAAAALAVVGQSCLLSLRKRMPFRSGGWGRSWPRKASDDPTALPASDAQVAEFPGHRRSIALPPNVPCGAALPQPPLTHSAATQNECDLKPAWGFSLSALLLLLAATSLVIAPYILLAGKITSKKLPFVNVPPSEHAVAIATTEPTAGLLSEPGPGGQLPDEFSRPSKLLGVVALGVVELFRELAQGFYYLALIPLGIGTFWPGRPQPARPLALLHILLMNGHAALLMLLYLTAGYISHRHLIPLVALMLPTMSAGALMMVGYAARWLPALAPPRRAVAVAVIVFYVGLLPKCLVPLQAAYLPVYQAALWVKDQAQPGDSVLSTSGYVRFYTDLPGILVGSEAPNLPTAFYFAPNKKWSYLVLEFDERRFDRQALCNSAGGYEQVLELAAHPRKSWAKVAVFRAREKSSAALVASLPDAAR